MALASLLLLLVFCALYLHRVLPNPPAALVKVTDKVSPHLEPLAFWTVIYGLVAILLTPIFVWGTLDVVIRLLANATLVIMALPAAYGQINTRMGGKVNEAIAESLADMIRGIERQQKFVGYAGCAMAVLLFAVMFR